MKKTFLKYFKAFTLVGVMASFVAFTSCSDDDGPTAPVATETIWEIVEGRDNLSALESELLAVGLDANLKADGELTLFAPTNAALATLLGTLGLENFRTVSTDIATAVLAYHVHAGTILSTDLVAGEMFSTLQGENFEVVAGPAIKSGATSNATFQVTDIAATNGTVHIIEVVMVPPTIGGTIVATLGTLAQPVLLGANFSILSAAIQKADAGKDAAATIIGALTAAQDLTVFAPDNATFEAGNITLDTYDAATWDLIIRNHVVVGQGGGTEDGINTLGPDDLTTGSTYTTFASSEALAQRLFIARRPASATATTINPAAPGIYIDSNQNFNPDVEGNNLDAEIVVPDAVTASNGRIHVIAGVLAPFIPAAGEK